MNPSSLETQDLFLECLGFARHITLEALGIFVELRLTLDQIHSNMKLENALRGEFQDGILEEAG